MACGAIVVPLLFAAMARGAERTSGFRTVSAGNSSLKWRPSSGGRATAVKSSEASASEALFAAPPVPTPDLLETDESAKPLEGNTAAARIMRDDAVVPVQGTKPVDDPFGDKPAAPAVQTPAPRLLTQPTPDPEVSQPRTPLTLPSTAPTNLPPLPSSTDQMAQAGGLFSQEPCPKISDLKAINQISNVIAASPGELPRECYFDESVATPENRAWAMTQYHWQVPQAAVL
ncbi:MAG: hypothetical protein J0M17_17560 [Planctomycetes bacterium]|nr:hypothetical protein [Planctomycetota bacterium]